VYRVICTKSRNYSS